MSNDGPPAGARWALLHDGPLRTWHQRCIDHLDHAGARLDLVVELPAATPAPGPWVRRARSLQRATRPAAATRLTARDHDDAAEQLAAYGPEVIVDLTWTGHDRTSSGPLDGIAPFGCWRIGPQRAGLPGAAEIREGATTLRLELRRFGGAARAPHDVLRWGRLPVRRYSLTATVDLALLTAAEWPALAFADARRGVTLSSPPEGPPVGSRRRAASRRGLPVTVGRNRIRRWARFASSEEWNIGVAAAPLPSFLSADRPPVTWLPEPAGGTFLADPFGLTRGDELWIYAESYDHRSGKGRLCRVPWDHARSVAHDLAPDVPSGVHLSYPFLLRHDGRDYCIPETAEAREVSLHSVDPETGDLHREATLLHDVAALDTTVVRWDGGWWMFFTDGDRGGEWWLTAWHAPDLRGPWTPHEANPVKQDVGSSRPGGTPFVHDGVLYRPAQDDSTTYGGAVVINRVLRLSPTEFVEEVATIVGPDTAGPYPEGLHTISAAGAFTLLDGKRSVRRLGLLPHKLAARLRRRMAG